MTQINNLGFKELKDLAKELKIAEIPKKKVDIMDLILLATKEEVKEGDEVVLSVEEVKEVLKTAEVIVLSDEELKAIEKKIKGDSSVKSEKVIDEKMMENIRKEYVLSPQPFTLAELPNGNYRIINRLRQWISQEDTMKVLAPLHKKFNILSVEPDHSPKV